jgi:hypothetical protein
MAAMNQEFLKTRLGNIWVRRIQNDPHHIIHVSPVQRATRWNSPSAQLEPQWGE